MMHYKSLRRIQRQSSFFLAFLMQLRMGVLLPVKAGSFLGHPLQLTTKNTLRENIHQSINNKLLISTQEKYRRKHTKRCVMRIHKRTHLQSRKSNYQNDFFYSNNGDRSDDNDDDNDEITFLESQDLEIIQQSSTNPPPPSAITASITDTDIISNQSSSPLSSSTLNQFGTQIIRDEQWHSRSKSWIIIVDDEESIRSAVGQYLFDRGYQVTACPDAMTALDILRNNISSNNSNINGRDSARLPDAIVSDIRMPEISGLQFLQTIRSDSTFVSIPVILLTAKGMTQDRIAGYDAGADAYLPKPFDPEELISILDNVIARRDFWNGDTGGEEDLLDSLKGDIEDIKNLLLEQGGGNAAASGAPNGKGWVVDAQLERVSLSVDETQVLQLLCRGWMNKEIAHDMKYSIRRVEQHLTSMYRKTGCVNRTELVRWAVSTGYVDL